MTDDYYLSMDIMQESFLRCFERYRDKTLNISLLYTIARNLFIDFTRREKRKSPLEQDTADQNADIENEYRVKRNTGRLLTQ
jgi:RNA polymerase sigma-70 factor (ECF subfamily)